MIRFRHNNILSIIFLFYSICNVLFAEDNASIEQWKFDLQILHGFDMSQKVVILHIQLLFNEKTF